MTTNLIPENRFTANELALDIRTRRKKSKEIVSDYLDRIHEVNKFLNAVVCIREEAIDEAFEADRKVRNREHLGPLHGVPMTIKDSFDVEGIPTTSGSIGRKNKTAKTDATVVRRLKDAGAIIIGKTNLPEFCLAYETDNNLFGRTNNPFNLDRTCGGSSGGEAAIIAAGGSPLGLGSDSGGSIRIPAHFCGIAGFKPTSCRVPLTGHIPETAGIWKNFVQPGPLGTSVKDLMLVLQIINGSDSIDPDTVPVDSESFQQLDIASLKIGFYKNNCIADLSKEIVEVMDQIVGCLSECGFNIKEKHPDCLKQIYEINQILLNIDGGDGIKELLISNGTSVDQGHFLTLELINNSSKIHITDVDLNNALSDLTHYKKKMLAFMEDFDILITPVFTRSAFEHGKSLDPMISDGFSYVTIFNLIGWPAVVIPVSRSDDGMPIGIQIASIPWNDKVVLDFALFLEERLKKHMV